jgi:hypothetical protein
MVCLIAAAGIDHSPDGHRALRPLWRCAVDGAPWPCSDARRALRTAFGSDSVGLQRHLVLLLMVAERELSGVALAELYRRFVAWALTAGEQCRVCGSPRHAVLPGLPPRVVPCDKVRRLMRGDET